MTMTAPPPDHLTQGTAAWWHSVIDSYELEAHHLRLLTLACEAWDRGQQARVILAKDGPVIVTKAGDIRAHPAVAIERDARLAFARLLRELDLDHEPGDRSRPPALPSNRG